MLISFQGNRRVVQAASQPVTLRHKVSHSVTPVTLVETDLHQLRNGRKLRVVTLDRSFPDRDRTGASGRRLSYSDWTLLP